MPWRTVGMIFLVLLALVALGVFGFTMVQRTEGYKAETQEFYSFEPHPAIVIGGCFSYRVMQAETNKARRIRKGTVKPKQDKNATPVKPEIRK